MTARRAPKKIPRATHDLRVTRVGEYVFMSWGTDAPPAVSDAEAAILALVLEGKSNREVARARGVSERTVANQLASVFKKLGVKSRYELLYRAKAAVR